MPVSAQNRQPDPVALELAGRLQARVPDWPVYLFGSRARGDYRPDSVVDLMVLSPKPLTAFDQTLLAYKLDPARDRLYADHIHFDIVNLTQSEFTEARHAYDHVAGDAQRDGLTPDGEHLPIVPQDNPWISCRRRIRLCRHALFHALCLAGQPENRLWQCQHAMESILKAWLAAQGAAYIETNKLGGLFGSHDIRKLCNAVRDLPGTHPWPPRTWQNMLTWSREKGTYQEVPPPARPVWTCPTRIWLWPAWLPPKPTLPLY